jgi:hypothetical protein
MPESENVKPEKYPLSEAYFLLDEHTIQLHIHGEHNWHKELQARLTEMGVVCLEKFCSPCG